MYTRLGVTLIGLELRSPVSGATRILLNPSGMLVPDVFLYAVQGIVLADSVEEASLLSRGNFSSVKTLRNVEVGHRDGEHSFLSSSLRLTTSAPCCTAPPACS